MLRKVPEARFKVSMGLAAVPSSLPLSSKVPPARVTVLAAVPSTMFPPESKRPPIRLSVPSWPSPTVVVPVTVRSPPVLTESVPVPATTEAEKPLVALLPRLRLFAVAPALSSTTEKPLLMTTSCAEVGGILVSQLRSEFQKGSMASLSKNTVVAFMAA